MRVLVLGGAGFLGSHLCEYYLEKGSDVIAVDDLSSGQTENVRSFMGNSRFSFIQQDICSELKIAGSLDLIFNFASLASPDQYVKQAIHTLRTGSQGTESALHLAQQKDARMIMASTSEVYGDPLVHPQHETYRGNVSTTGPRSMYDEAKRFSEALCSAFIREHSTRVGIVRIFNTYGPRLAPDDGRVISNFVTQALDGKPLTIYGSGTQTRSFCYVTDLIRAIDLFANSSHDGPINLGNPDEFTILELVDTLCQILGVDLEVDHRPLPVDDPIRRCPDISLAKKLLQWEPEINLTKGLELTIDWYKSQRLMH
jgi:dTDP-glucose 4,6-dehydratase